MKYILAVIILMLSMLLPAEDVMPDFRLPDINGKDVTLSDILHKGPVLVDFWATWCVPCKKSMVALNELALKYDTLTVVMVSIDSPKDIQKAKSYLKGTDYKFVMLFDSEKKLANKLNVVNPPRTVIIDSTGVIKFSHDGYEQGNEQEYEAVIRKLLALPIDETAIPEKAEADPAVPDPAEPVIPTDGCH